MDPEKRRKLEEKLRDMLQMEHRAQPEPLQLKAQPSSCNVIRRRKGQADHRLPFKS
jgi:hypothetical protein